jgi:diguanylate cyclase (GGDEF)-like protein
VHVRTAALAYQATHDDLTGLANRALLQDRITRALAAAQQQGTQVAVLLLDLDRFKTVNDSLGHNSGDRLLSSVAARLQAVLRQTDTLARLGGDEFVIVLPGLTGREAVVRVCEKVLDTVAQPVTIDQHQVWTGASVGIALHPQDGACHEELLRNADAAMYLAKAAGGSGYRFYQPEMNASAMQRLEVEAGLRQALERGELAVHYQPKVCTKGERIVGVEALVRWNHPLRGLVSPNEFIPVAEDTGLIVPLGAWVLEQACSQLALWHRQGHTQLTMAVNLSPIQFCQPGLAAEVEAIITRTGVPAAAVELELTERMVMEDPEAAARTLAHLRRIGIRTALDDFGTGHSNLSSLRRFQIDALKIDRSFIDLAPVNADDDAIARAIVALARSLGLSVVAEGVETQAQWDYVRAIGCDQGQGYLFAQALPAAVFAERLLAAPGVITAATPSSAGQPQTVD